MLNDLQAKFESWKELNKHLDDGMQFYGKLSGLLANLQMKVKDFCMAREFETKDLLR